MWRPERLVSGPHPVRERDIPALNRVFAEAFTDRYRRDGLVGVRVPQLNPAIWRYAITDAGEGAMVWFDERDHVVAFNIVHASGAEGWMGPLAVRADRQGLGIGRGIVEAALEWLKSRSVTTIGLETMPRTVENIGFYSRLGFTPHHLTVTMTGEATRRAVSGPVERLRSVPPPARRAWLGRLRERLQRSAPGYDFTREMQLTADLALGDTLAVEEDGAVSGFALWHAAPLTDGRPADELRVLKLFADGPATFERLLVALERSAAQANVRRVAIRCQTIYAGAYHALLRRGYRVRWTDLRMTLEGYSEVRVPEGEVLFSNWEI